MAEATSSGRMLVHPISPWLLDSCLCSMQNSSGYSFRLDPRKDTRQFSDALICSDLKGFFLGAFSFSFIIP